MAITAPLEFTIEKLYQGEYWVNRYYLTGTIGAADAGMGDILDVERAIHMSSVTFTKMTVRTTAELDYVYATIPLNVPGLGTAAADSLMLPLYNTMRVDLGATAGRASRKYYRGVLYEGVTGATTLDATFVTSMNTAVAALLTVDILCDPQGDALISAKVFPAAQMRQLRRGSKKKLVP